MAGVVSFIKWARWIWLMIGPTLTRIGFDLANDIKRVSLEYAKSPEVKAMKSGTEKRKWVAARVREDVKLDDPDNFVEAYVVNLIIEMVVAHILEPDITTKKSNSMAGIMIGVILTIATVLTSVQQCKADTVVLPYINAGGWHTTLKAANFGSEPIPFDHLWDSTGIGAPGPILESWQIFTLENYPLLGGGSFELIVPEHTGVWTEITAPNGRSFQVHGMTKVGGDNINGYGVSQLYLGLNTTGAMRTYLFVTSPVGLAFTWAEYTAGHLVATHAVILAPGETTIPIMTEGIDGLTVQQGISLGGPGIPNPGVGYSLVLTSRQPDGELYAVWPMLQFYGSP